MTAAALLFAFAGVVAPPACAPKPPVVPVYTIPRGEVPRDVSSAPKITTPPQVVRPKG